MAFKIALTLLALVAASNAAVCGVPCEPAYIDSVPAVNAFGPACGSCGGFVAPAYVNVAPACADVDCLPPVASGCLSPCSNIVAPCAPRCGPIVALDPPTCGVNPAIALTLNRFGFGPTIATPDGLVVNGLLNNGCGNIVAEPYAL